VASLGPDRAFLGFAATFFVFHQIGTVLASDRLASAVDMLTPFVVVAAMALALAALYSSRAKIAALRASRAPLLVALVSGVAYVHGVGAHVAANAIHNEGIDASVVYFWDERLSHIEATLGWFGLVAALCLADRAGRGVERLPLVTGAALLGWTFFTSTVEGQVWWLELPAAVGFAVWAWRDGSRGPLLRASAAAFVGGAALIGIWAIAHGGVPEFSDL